MSATQDTRVGYEDVKSTPQLYGLLDQGLNVFGFGSVRFLKVTLHALCGNFLVSGCARIKDKEQSVVHKVCSKRLSRGMSDAHVSAFHSTLPQGHQAANRCTRRWLLPKRKQEQLLCQCLSWRPSRSRSSFVVVLAYCLFLLQRRSPELY